MADFSHVSEATEVESAIADNIYDTDCAGLAVSCHHADNGEGLFLDGFPYLVG
jgi:hypothetical protein